MEEQQAVMPEAAQPEEVTGEQAQAEKSEQVETSETTSPEETHVPLKAVQEERRKRQEIKQEAEYWRKVALGDIDNPHKPDTSVKPKPDQFNDYDDYVEALADYKAEQVFNKRTAEKQTLTREDIAKREESKVMAKAARDGENAAKKYADFYEVANTVVLPKHSLEAIYQSDIGTEITYFLGKNPHEMERIADLSPSRQIMELGKLEVKLQTKTANPEAKRSKQATSVESAGNGFAPQKNNLSQLREQAIKTGNWANYLLESGIVS